jgi:hypothetical protein
VPTFQPRGMCHPRVAAQTLDWRIWPYHRPMGKISGLKKTVQQLLTSLFRIRMPEKHKRAQLDGRR